MNLIAATLALMALVAPQAVRAADAYDWQALPDKAPEPLDNPTTAEKVELGRLLYFDPRFSATGTVSCNSCHNLMLGGDNPMTVDNAARAVAAFERTMITPDSPYDRFVKGDKDALTGEFPEQTMPRLPATPGWTLINSED